MQARVDVFHPENMTSFLNNVSATFLAAVFRHATHMIILQYLQWYHISFVEPC